MLLRNLFESINKSAVLGWGRGMGHKGHMLLAQAVLHHAQENNAKPFFVISRTSLVDPATGQPWADKPTFSKTKDDPLTPEEKLATYRKVFPQNAEVFSVASADASTLTKVLAKIAGEGFRKVILIVGEQEKDSFSFLTRPDKSGVPPYQQVGLTDLEIISRQDTTEPSSVKGSPEYQEGPRATPMRQVLLDPAKSEEEQFAVWRRDMPDNLSDEEVRDLMLKAKQRMSMVPASKRGKAEQKLAELNTLAPRTMYVKMPDDNWLKADYRETETIIGGGHSENDLIHFTAFSWVSPQTVQSLGLENNLAKPDPTGKNPRAQSSLVGQSGTDAFILGDRAIDVRDFSKADQGRIGDELPRQLKIQIIQWVEKHPAGQQAAGKENEGIMGFLARPHEPVKKKSASPAEMRKYFEKERVKATKTANTNQREPQRVYTRYDEDNLTTKKQFDNDEKGVAEGEYDSRKPFGVRYKVFAGREGRMTTKEYWTTSEEKLQRAVDKIQALDNFYEIDGYSYPKESQGVAEAFPNPGSGSTGSSKEDKRIAAALRKKHIPTTPNDKKEKGVAEGLNEFAPPERGDGQENRFNFQEEFESDDGEYLIELYRNVQSRSFAVSFHRNNIQYVMYPIDGIDAGDLSDGAARYVQEIKKNAAHGSQEDFVAMGSMDLEDFIPPEQGVAENKAAGINKMFNNLGDPVYANLQRVALLAMQGRQQEAAGRLQTVIKDADPAVQKKITDAVNNIKPVTINGRVADSSTLDKSKQHNDWIINTFIPWVQSLLGQQGVAEAPMSAAARWQRAMDRQRAKSDASLARTPSSIPKPEPKKDEKIAEKQRLDPSCWKGYRKQGTKMKGDTRVNNCVKVSENVENKMARLITLLENK